MRPIIGITCSTAAESPRTQYALNLLRDYTVRDYSEAVTESGGAPILIPLLRDEGALERILSSLDGLLLSGGADIDPRYYNEDPCPNLGEIDSAKDAVESKLVKMALDRDMPILGICRGVQAINVMGGGTLHQDIPSQVPGSIKHNQGADPRFPSHQIKVEPGSRMFKIMECDTIWVSSHHHQAVKDVAPGYVATARASDGVIEGIESMAHRFVIGVQWHPERTFHTDGPSRSIFRAFIESAKGG